MSNSEKRSIVSVTINYDNGTSDTVEYFALVGSNENTWYKMMISPPKTDDKIEMNNMLAGLSKSLIAAIEDDV